MKKSVMAEDIIKHFKHEVANKEEFYTVQLFDKMTMKQVLDSILRDKGHISLRGVNYAYFTCRAY